METINGTFATAKIFTTSNTETAIDQYALAQIQALCDNDSSKGCRIRIMPNLVGIDIGCGMLLSKIKGKKVEFQKLDTIIRDNISSGFSIRNHAHRYAREFDFSKLYCYESIKQDKALLSLGSLGGGNHFIEVDKDSNNNLYVVIHSGSRHLGKEVTEYYLSKGAKHLKGNEMENTREL